MYPNLYKSIDYYFSPKLHSYPLFTNLYLSFIHPLFTKPFSLIYSSFIHKTSLSHLLILNSSNIFHILNLFTKPLPYSQPIHQTSFHILNLFNKPLPYSQPIHQTASIFATYLVNLFYIPNLYTF